MKLTNALPQPTVESRLDIGFPQHPKDWALAPAEFTANDLRIMGHPVMEDWETPYMQELSRVAAGSGGDVLEVGFGMGISANFIQKTSVASHTIVEANADVFARLTIFAAQARNVRPCLGFWEDVCPAFPAESFSAILFDTYPLREDEIHTNHFLFFREAHRLLQPDGVLTYYSDEARDFSPAHIAKLTEAGFTNVDRRVCAVNPPAGCKYWQHNSLMVPIVRK
jgi:guanidinoacetate N-methyltransferase